MAKYIEREAFIEWLKRIPLIDLSDGRGLCRVIMEDDFKKAIKKMPKSIIADVAPVRHGRWEDGRCSNCKEEAVSTSFDEPIYDYDWEENLRYSHTETHTEYHLTNYCPNCGAIMDLEG